MAITSTSKPLVVVLNWNGKDDSIECIKSLQAQTLLPTILVVDNGSVDGSVEALEANFKDIILIKEPKNLGFAGGVNVGIRYAIKHGFESVALFNNDAVADTAWLESLAKELSDEKPVVTGLLLNQNGLIDSTAELYSLWGVAFPRSRGLEKALAPDSGYIFGASGGATLYKTSLFKEIGLFDESFFAYYEDVDISFRTQLTGHKVYYTKNAIAHHKPGSTSGKIPGFTIYQIFKNLPLLYIKNVPTGLLLPVGLRFFVLYWLMFGNAVKNKSGLPALKGWLASIWYFWIKAIWNRLSIQARKSVSTSYIKSIILHDLPPEQTGMRKLRKFITRKG